MLKGQLGWKGERGYSAYEIAVQNGYEGTEEEWAESFINSENYYDKTQSDAKYKVKNDFAVIEGTITLTSGVGDATFDYPDGFSSSNCVPIAWGDNSSDIAEGTPERKDWFFNTPKWEVYLAEEGILLRCNGIGPGSLTCSCKIVLMKVS